MGYSFVRFLPKESGVRCITNLRRRAYKLVGMSKIVCADVRNRICLEGVGSKSFLVRALILSCNPFSVFSILRRYRLG